MILDLEKPVIHQLIEQRATNRGLVVVAKCGATSSRPSGEPKPPEFSGWHSDITCEACLG